MQILKGKSLWISEYFEFQKFHRIKTFNFKEKKIGATFITHLQKYSKLLKDFDFLSIIQQSGN